MSAEEQRVEEQEQVDGVHETTEPAEPDPAGEVEHDLDELLARAGKADEYLALAQRTQADFENFRKRMTRDVAAAEARGVSRLAKELLPALDNLGRALAAAREDPAHPEADGHLLTGVQLVHDELLAVLKRVGIEPFSPRGERFDPNEHEAMAQQPVEGAESGTVVEVYQQGFRHGESVLRPARVVVAA
ncbi:MAG: nucleotide exchange factor GrpE [Conexibacter sp.]